MNNCPIHGEVAEPCCILHDNAWAQVGYYQGELRQEQEARKELESRMLPMIVEIRALRQAAAEKDEYIKQCRHELKLAITAVVDYIDSLPEGEVPLQDLKLREDLVEVLNEQDS